MNPRSSATAPITALPTLPLTVDLLFESSPDCAKLLDVDGKLLSMNGNGQCLMEIDDFDALYGLTWATIWPEDVRAQVDSALECARCGKIGQFNAFCPTAKGTPKWWDVRITPINDAKGQIQGFLSVSRDVTALHKLLDERRRAEMFSRGQQQALEQAVAGAPLSDILHTLARTAESYTDGMMLASVLVLDEAGTRLKVGAAPSFPATYGTIVDSAAIEPEAVSFGAAVFRKQPVIVQNIATASSETVMRELAGIQGLGACWSYPILSGGEQVHGVFAFYYKQMRHPTGLEQEAMQVLVHTAALLLGRHHEMRERAAAEHELRRFAAQLSELNRRKTEFLAILAHELRNPLAPIRNGMEVMRLASSNPAVVSRVKDMMARQIDHMVHLIDDLLDIARIDSGKIELKKSRVDLKGIAAAAIEASLPLIDAGRHHLEVRIADEALLLNADETRLAQVLTNLLTNAAKYTEAGGCIELSASKEGSQAVISVKDTGIGIPEAELETIFDMFSQVERSLAHSQGGLGIGLSLVSHLIRMHGGSVTASSPGEGKGSNFVVRLPLAEAGPTDLRESGAPQLPGEPHAPLNILIADDNVDAAETLAMLLRLQGHAVSAVNGGYAALEQIRERQQDVVFLDIGMPDLNGYEVVRRIRKMDGMENTTVVALTGWGTSSDRVEADQAGFDHHLTKPADIRSIELLLRRCQSQVHR